MSTDEEINWDDTEGHPVCGAVDETQGFGPCNMRLGHPVSTGHFDAHDNQWQEEEITLSTPTDHKRRRFRTLGGALAAIGLHDQVVVRRIETIVEQHEDEWRSETNPHLGGLEYWVTASRSYVAVGSVWEGTSGRVFAYLHKNRVQFENGDVRHVD